MQCSKTWILLTMLSCLACQMPSAMAGKPTKNDQATVSVTFDDHHLEPNDLSQRPSDLVRSDGLGDFAASIDGRLFLYASYNSKSKPGNPSRFLWFGFSTTHVIYDGQSPPPDGLYPVQMSVGSMDNAIESPGVAFPARVLIYFDTPDATTWAVLWSSSDIHPPTVTGFDHDGDGTSDQVYLSVPSQAKGELGYQGQSRKGGSWGVDVGLFSMPFGMTITLSDSQ